MKSAPSTRVRRSSSTTLVFLALAAGAIGLGVALVLLLGGVRGLGLGAGCVGAGVVFVVIGLVLGGTAPCPSCGQPIHGLSTSTNAPTPCIHCGAYVEGTNSEITVVPDDRVAPRPAFRAAMPGKPSWPVGCCVCGEPATRTVPVELDVDAQEAKSDLEYATRDPRKTPKKTLRAEVPHCASHTDGAALTGLSEATLGIRFRSYAYQRAFLGANPRPGVGGISG